MFDAFLGRHVVSRNHIFREVSRFGVLKASYVRTWIRRFCSTNHKDIDASRTLKNPMQFDVSSSPGLTRLLS